MNSNNLTTSTTPYVRWQYWDWILSVTVNSIFIPMTVWILFSLIYYGNKSKMWVTRKKKNFEKLNAGYILMAAVLCAATALLRFIASQLVFNIGFSHGEDIKCKIVFDALIISFCFAIFSVHIYFWMRQIVFYTNRMLNIDFSKGLRFFSYVSIILILLGELGVILVSTIPTKYMSTLEGCVYFPINLTFSAIIVIVNSLVLLLGQIILVGLLIYPLRKQWKQKGYLKICGIANCFSQRGDQQNSRRKTPNHRSVRNKKITLILSRTVYFSIVIVISHLVLLVVSTYGFTGRNISTMLYDVETFANLAFVVTSIGDWQKIIRLESSTYSVRKQRTSADPVTVMKPSSQTRLTIINKSNP